MADSRCLTCGALVTFNVFDNSHETLLGQPCPDPFLVPLNSNEPRRGDSVECYICGKLELVIDESTMTYRWPEGWEKDDRGRPRCYKHRPEPALATFGDRIRAKSR